MRRAEDEVTRLGPEMRPEQPQSRPSELAPVDTTDYRFSDVAAIVAAHPGLRAYQALQAWSGYSKLYGEGPDGELDDTFYKMTKGSTHV